MLLGSLVLWTQALAGLALPTAEPAHACACCPGPKCTCCLDRPESDPVPVPAAAFQLSGGRLAVPDLLPAAAVAGELPLVQRPARQTYRATDALLRVPAYRWHCALLL